MSNSTFASQENTVQFEGESSSLSAVTWDLSKNEIKSLTNIVTGANNTLNLYCKLEAQKVYCQAQ